MMKYKNIAADGYIKANILNKAIKLNLIHDIKKRR